MIKIFIALEGFLIGMLFEYLLRVEFNFGVLCLLIVILIGLIIKLIK